MRRDVIPTGRWTEALDRVIVLATSSPSLDVLTMRRSHGYAPAEPVEVFAQEGALFAVARYAHGGWLLLQLNVELWRERRLASLRAVA